MASPDPFSRITWPYHFTDRRNLSLIWDLDGLWSTTKLNEMAVKFYPGGNQHSLVADEMFGIDRYVHLCFKSNHPMEYLAKWWCYLRRDPKWPKQLAGILREP
jgi:hypothetical protein